MTPDPVAGVGRSGHGIAVARHDYRDHGEVMEQAPTPEALCAFRVPPLGRSDAPECVQTSARVISANSQKRSRISGYAFTRAKSQACELQNCDFTHIPLGSEPGQETDRTGTLRRPPLPASRSDARR